MTTMAMRKRTPTDGPLVSVFDFLDYRAYLRAHYEAAKKRRGGYSFRTFAKRAGLKSPNFLKLVMDSQRNLGADSVTRFAEALDLGEEEAQFFSDLVAFAQADNNAEKTRVFERIAASRRFRSARRIDSLVHEYLSHWYHPVLRELVARPDFDRDPRWIAATLRPEITPRQAAQSLSLLLELGLIRENPTTGKLELDNPTLTTEHEVTSLGAANFHRQMMERAAASIDTVPAALRDLAALTVCVSPKLATEVKRRIHQFREALTELCDAESNGTIVYQLNVQWFPLSRTDEGPTT
jgi:uncharacterized protein (TIGR02147 family)